MVAMTLMVASCGEKKFEVNGTITNAEDKVMYLENVSLEGELNTLDSVKLDAKGDFSLSGKATTGPEFYRLRIDRQIINISIDSTETVTVKADYPTMATGYTVEGSNNCEMIRQLSLKQMDLINKMQAVGADRTLGIDASNDSILRMLKRYKDEIRTNYIYKDPASAYAYFALFQAVGNMLIFNPQGDKDDVKTYAAVATNWDTFHPGALRTENLHNIAMEGVKTNRIVESKQTSAVDPSLIHESGVIDVELEDNKGQKQTLTSLKGQVVLLDFCMFSSSESTERVMLLRDIYNKYHDRGLQIMQVSLDSDEHYWKTKTAALPWINVRDPQGADSNLLTLYNVYQLPTYFLVTKDNVLYKRDIQIENLEAELEKLL